MPAFLFQNTEVLAMPAKAPIPVKIGQPGVPDSRLMTHDSRLTTLASRLLKRFFFSID
jgi:hypothetical protein